MIAKVRELDVANYHVHGLGRRPSRADRMPLDLDAIRKWTARNIRVRNFYFRANPPELPRTVPCGCGRWFATTQGVGNHRARTSCEGRAS